jgi:hypothetical protein
MRHSGRSDARGGIAAAVFCVLTLALVSPAAAQTGGKLLPGLYDGALLKRWSAEYGPILEGWVEKEIAPGLPPAERAIARSITFDFPIDGAPFAFSSVPAIRRVIVPMSGVKLLHDLVYVNVLIAQTGYRDPSSVYMYLGALKYRPAADFPGGRYPAPFRAFKIDSGSLGLPVNDDAVVQRQHELAFDGAMLFLLAHEIGHVVRNHAGAKSLQQEIDADAFAIAALQRTQSSPLGVMHYMMLSGFWAPHRSEWNTEAEYLAAVAKSGHPLNGERIERTGRAIAAGAAGFFPGATASDPRIPLVKEIGDRLVGVGKDFDNLTKQKDLRDLILEMDLRKLLALGAAPQPWGFVRVQSGQQAALLAQAKINFSSALEQLAGLQNDLGKKAKAHRFLVDNLDGPLPERFLDLLKIELGLLQKLLDTVDLSGKTVAIAEALTDGKQYKTSFAEVRSNAQLLDGGLRQLQATLKANQGARDLFRAKLGQTVNARMQQNPSLAGTLISVRTELDPGLYDMQLQQLRAILGSVIVTLGVLK